jgi:hypothetical protein
MRLRWMNREHGFGLFISASAFRERHVGALFNSNQSSPFLKEIAILHIYRMFDKSWIQLRKSLNYKFRSNVKQYLI